MSHEYEVVSVVGTREGCIIELRWSPSEGYWIAERRAGSERRMLPESFALENQRYALDLRAQTLRELGAGLARHWREAWPAWRECVRLRAVLAALDPFLSRARSSVRRRPERRAMPGATLR